MELKQPLTKLYYNIGEVADLFGVNTSLIRYWEKEFPSLHPKKSKSGIRKYTQKDIEAFGKVYALVKENGFTIDGAKKAIKSGNTPVSLDVQASTPTSMSKAFDQQELLARLQKALEKLERIRKELSENGM